MAERDDERVQAALHAVLVGDVEGLRAALAADPGVVDIRVGGDTMLELLTQPDAELSPEMVDALIPGRVPIWTGP